MYGITKDSLMGLKARKSLQWALIHLLLVLFLMLSLYPVFWILQISLKTQVEAFKMPPSWIFKPTFRHFRSLLIGSEFPNRVFNSFVVSSFATFLALIIGTPAAYVFSRLKFRFKNF